LSDVEHPPGHSFGSVVVAEFVIDFLAMAASGDLGSWWYEFLVTLIVTRLTFDGVET
jgi:hypothetical protein